MKQKFKAFGWIIFLAVFIIGPILYGNMADAAVYNPYKTPPTGVDFKIPPKMDRGLSDARRSFLYGEITTDCMNWAEDWARAVSTDKQGQAFFETLQLNKGNKTLWGAWESQTKDEISYVEGEKTPIRTKRLFDLFNTLATSWRPGNSIKEYRESLFINCVDVLFAGGKGNF